MNTLSLVLDEVLQFRLRQRQEDRLLEVLDGPAAETMAAWSQATPTHCRHFSRKHPIPLWGLLPVPGHRMCGSCLTLTDAATPAPDRCQACSGPLGADRGADVVAIGHDPFLTVLGHVCPPCRDLCNTQPPEGEDHG